MKLARFIPGLKAGDFTLRAVKEKKLSERSYNMAHCAFTKLFVIEPQFLANFSKIAVIE